MAIHVMHNYDSLYSAAITVCEFAPGPTDRESICMKGAGMENSDLSSVVHFDLVVIGAGINGLGIARDAAERGLSVALIEQFDICSGVSAWSGRLIHGGLRYLEHMDIGLVRESLRERERLFKLAPHLVKPANLIMPFYKKNKRPAWLIAMGMIAYDLLSFDKSVSWHRIYSKAKVSARFAGMEKNGLGGAALFVDGRVEYAERLCVELAVAASEAGCIIRNHERSTELIIDNGEIKGLKTVDAGGKESTITAQAVINAAGPWVDLVNTGFDSHQQPPRLIGGSKGSHIIVDPFPGAPNDVIYYESQSDGRLVLVIPWMGRYLIGTTDILFDEEPDSARAQQDEIDYILTEVNTLIPEAKITKSDILFTYSGVRPLPYKPGVSEWKIPRSHIVHNHKAEGVEKLYSIVSGKLTTYRQLAEDAVDLVFKEVVKQKRKTLTKDVPFPGARNFDSDVLQDELLKISGIESDTAARLVDLYGSRSLEIGSLVKANSALAERFDPDSAAISAELMFAVDKEFAKSLADVMARRTMLAFQPGHGLVGAARAAEILGNHLGWTKTQIIDNLNDYEHWLDHLRVPTS